jgi:hypothetical protein
MLVPSGIVIGLGCGGGTGAAVLVAGVVLAGAAEAVTATGFAMEGLFAAGARDAVEAVRLAMELGITGGTGGCAAPTGEEGGADATE